MPPVRTPKNPGERKRPGPKPKPLAERVYHPPKERVRNRTAYSKSRKIEVLMFLTHHKIPRYPGVALDDPKAQLFRRPSYHEAHKMFGVAESTVGDWWREQEKIVKQQGSSYRAENKEWSCRWPRMEEELFAEFIGRREKQILVHCSWFRLTSTELFAKHYPEATKVFAFSAGWFDGFCKRWGLSSRAITKIASKIPAEYLYYIINFIRFIRRNSQPRNFYEVNLITTDVGCFSLCRILNIDETPIPFEYLDGYTYNLKGTKTVSGKTEAGGWDKRQATLILYIFADGIPRIKPKIIFKGSSGEKALIRKQEGHKWSTGVTVEINEKAWNNSALYDKFIDEELIPTLEMKSNNDKALLVHDVAPFHKTEAIKEKLRANNIVNAMIPGGCTGLVQPLDTHINKPFKLYMRDCTDRYMNTRQKAKMSVSEMRIMTTFVAAEAWVKFSNDKAAVVAKSFRDVGITLPVDGSHDNELAIKGFKSEILAPYVKDWLHDLPIPPKERRSRHRPLPAEDESDLSLSYQWIHEELLLPRPAGSATVTADSD